LTAPLTKKGNDGFGGGATTVTSQPSTANAVTAISRPPFGFAYSITIRQVNGIRREVVEVPTAPLAAGIESSGDGDHQNP